MKRLIMLSMIGLCLQFDVFAQNDIQPYGYYIDALRFSQTILGGSSRIQSLGGAQIALGGDLSLALSNPAGLGFYNRSDFSFTPTISFKNSISDYLGETSLDSRTRFNFNQLGIAFHLKPKEEGIYKGGAFAISLTRINDFYNNYTIEAVNNETTIVDSFLEQANGATTDQFTGNDLVSLAYYNYLIGPENAIDPSYPDDFYFTDVPIAATSLPLQTEFIRNEGAQYQWSFSYGGNVSDKFFFGLGLGIVDLEYHSNRTYSESFIVDPLNDLEISEELRINGVGINGSAGIIIKPVPYLNIGASFNTPTYYGLDDSYAADMGTDWNNFLYEDLIGGDTVLNNISAQTDLLVSDYNLTTPWRFNGGLAFFVEKYGFISVDVEYIDFTKTRLNSSLFSMRDDNLAIKELAPTAVNVRTGAELRLNILRLRAGYGHYATAQDALDPLNSSGNTFSGGLGVRLSKVYFDLGVIYTRLKQTYTPYLMIDAPTPVADITSDNTKLMFTVGFNY